MILRGATLIDGTDPAVDVKVLDAVRLVIADGRTVLSRL